MRWNRWTRVGFALLAPIVVAVMLAAGEWSQPPASAQSDPKAADGKAAPSKVAKPKGGASAESARSEHVRELQQALTSAGYDPGPIDGKLGPRTKAALRKYVAVPPPQVPSPADKVISQFRSSNEVRQGQ